MRDVSDAHKALAVRPLTNTGGCSAIIAFFLVSQRQRSIKKTAFFVADLPFKIRGNESPPGAMAALVRVGRERKNDSIMNDIEKWAV